MGSLGAVRVLAVSLQLRNAQFLSSMTRTTAQVNALNIGLGNTGRQVGLMRSQLALFALGAGVVFGAIFQSYSKFQRQTNLAAVATGNFTGNIQRIRDESIALAESFGLAIDDAVDLEKELVFLGVTNDVLRQKIAKSAVALSILSNVPAKQAAESIFKLAQFTARSNDEFELLLNNSDLIASQFHVVGVAIAAGTDDLIAFNEKFKTAGIAAHFQTGELIALEGALAHVDAAMASTFTTTMITLLSATGHRLHSIATLIGTTDEEARKLRTNNPTEFLLRFGAALEAAEKAGTPAVDVLNELGIVEKRQVKTILALLGAQGIYAQNLKLTADQNNYVATGHRDSLAIYTQMSPIITDLTTQWGQFAASLRSTGFNVAETLVPGLSTLLAALKGIFDTLSKHKALTGVLSILALSGGANVGYKSLNTFLATGVGGVFAGHIRNAFDFVPNIRNSVNAGLAVRGAQGATALNFASLGVATAPSPLLAQLIASPMSFIRAGVSGALEGAVGRFGVGGTVGIILAAIELLTPVFKELGNVFANLGKHGGILGFVAKMFAVLFKTLELIGNVIGFVFDSIVGAIKWLINNIPGLKEFVGFLNGAADTAINAVTDANAQVYAARGQSQNEATKPADNPPAPYAVINTNIYADVGDHSELRRTADQAAIRAAFSLKARLNTS